jgi:hypothetical protein
MGDYNTNLSGPSLYDKLGKFYDAEQGVFDNRVLKADQNSDNKVSVEEFFDEFMWGKDNKTDLDPSIGNLDIEDYADTVAVFDDNKNGKLEKNEQNDPQLQNFPGVNGRKNYKSYYEAAQNASGGHGNHHGHHGDGWGHGHNSWRNQGPKTAEQMDTNKSGTIGPWEFARNAKEFGYDDFQKGSREDRWAMWNDFQAKANLDGSVDQFGRGTVDTSEAQLVLNQVSRNREIDGNKDGKLGLDEIFKNFDTVFPGQPADLTTGDKLALINQLYATEDTDQDGEVSFQELNRFLLAPDIASLTDENKDGSLSLIELLKNYSVLGLGQPASDGEKLQGLMELFQADENGDQQLSKVELANYLRQKQLNV